MSKINQTEFDNILMGILSEMTAAQLLDISGIYEIVSEEFNNEVLDIYETNKEGRRMK